MSTGTNEPANDPERGGSGWAGGQVARDQDDHSETSAAAGREAEPGHPGTTEQPAGAEAGWSGNQVVRDQDEQPEEPPSAWDGGEVVADFGDGPEHQ